MDFGSDPTMLILLDCLVVAATEMAVLLEVDGVEHWVPRSNLQQPDLRADRRNLVDVELKEWFCRQEAII